MTDKIKLIPAGQILEYKGDFYTPEELAELLNATGEFEVQVVDRETWFSKAIGDMEEG